MSGCDELHGQDGNEISLEMLEDDESFETEAFLVEWRRCGSY